jgi:PhnB protein
MSKANRANKFKPDGWHTVTPRIFADDVAGMVGFLKAVFNARGEEQVGKPAELQIGDSIVMVSDGGGQRETLPAFLYVYVEDAEGTYERAVAAGAATIEVPTDTPYGDRRATVRDRWGNVWQIATHREGK